MNNWTESHTEGLAQYPTPFHLNLDVWQPSNDFFLLSSDFIFLKTLLIRAMSTQSAYKLTTIKIWLKTGSLFFFETVQKLQ